MNFVSILLGSKSDHDIIKYCIDTLEKFDVKYEIVVSSALKSPKRTEQYIKDAEKKGAVVFIVASQMVSHLSGATSALTTKPVIALPIKSDDINSTEIMLSTLQMPAGLPVSTVSLGKSGAINAAYFAMQILAIRDKELSVKLKEDRIVQAKKVETDSKEIEVLISI